MIRWKKVFKAVGVIVGGAAAIITLLCCGFVVWFTPLDPIHEGNARRVKTGMSEAEVRRILGDPDEAASAPPKSRDGEVAADPKWTRRKAWRGTWGGSIDVFFAGDGTVQEVMFFQSPIIEVPLVHRVYRAIGFE